MRTLVRVGEYLLLLPKGTTVDTSNLALGLDGAVVVERSKYNHGLSISNAQSFGIEIIPDSCVPEPKGKEEEPIE